MLNTLITSKTRLKLLLKFFINPDNTGYLRGLAKEFSESTNAVRKELNKLEEAGYLSVLEEEDRKKVFQVNQSHPLFKIIQKLVRSSVGLDVLVAQVLRQQPILRPFFLAISEVSKTLRTPGASTPTGFSQKTFYNGHKNG